MSSQPLPLSSWAKNISPSPTLAVDAKAKALQAAGEDVCSFAAGEPDFDTPDHIKEACIAALKGGKTKYAPTPGIEPLRQAIADKYAAEYASRWRLPRWSFRPEASSRAIWRFWPRARRAMR